MYDSPKYKSSSDVIAHNDDTILECDSYNNIIRSKFQLFAWLSYMNDSQFDLQSKYNILTQVITKAVEMNEMLQSKILQIEYQNSLLTTQANKKKEWKKELSKIKDCLFKKTPQSTQDTDLKEFIAMLYSEHTKNANYHPVDSPLKADYKLLNKEYGSMQSNLLTKADATQLVDENEGTVETRIEKLSKYCNDLITVNRVLDMENKLAISQLVRSRTKKNEEHKYIPSINRTNSKNRKPDCFTHLS